MCAYLFRDYNHNFTLFADMNSHILTLSPFYGKTYETSPLISKQASLQHHPLNHGTPVHSFPHWASSSQQPSTITPYQHQNLNIRSSPRKTPIGGCKSPIGSRFEMNLRSTPKKSLDRSDYEQELPIFGGRGGINMKSNEDDFRSKKFLNFGGTSCQRDSME